MNVKKISVFVWVTLSIMHCLKQEKFYSLEHGAKVVQLDFTEARLSLKVDPSGQLLKEFIAINNRVLDRFSAEDRKKIGVHVCPGGDSDCSVSQSLSCACDVDLFFSI